MCMCMHLVSRLTLQDPDRNPHFNFDFNTDFDFRYQT